MNEFVAVVGAAVVGAAVVGAAAVVAVRAAEHQSNSQPVCPSVSQSVGHLVHQSFSHPLAHSFIYAVKRFAQTSSDSDSSCPCFSYIVCLLS